MVSDEASTASRVAVAVQALRLGDVVPVTETVPPTVKSGFSVALACEPVNTKMVAPLAESTKPSIEPSES